jgi:LytS/YehU family sensor histidine kinase
MERKPLIPFDEELSLVKDYLALEKTRLEERLDIKMSVSEECSIFDVPPLLLQTLVENGIKHGISQFEKGGRLSFDASVVNGFLKVSIVNKGSISEVKNGKKGIGLDISKQRLKLLYGDVAEFKITEEKGNVRAELLIPKESNKIEYESTDS